jgi:ABC-type uncharacterized transport system substrate-binding protein
LPGIRFASRGSAYRSSIASRRYLRRTKTSRRADKILKGANPAELPVEQTSKFEMVINRRTAKELRVRIPADLLLRADRLID